MNLWASVTTKWLKRFVVEAHEEPTVLEMPKCPKSPSVLGSPAKYEDE